MRKILSRCFMEFIHNLTWEQVPEDVKEVAVMRVLDLISVLPELPEIR